MLRQKDKPSFNVSDQLGLS